MVAVAVARPFGRGRHDRQPTARRLHRLRHARAALAIGRAPGRFVVVHAFNVAPHQSPGVGLPSSVGLSFTDSFIGKNMQYRRLGRSGLQVSELSLGSWVTYHNQVDTGAATEMLAAAMDAGVNFFDNAEVYAKRAERGRDGRGLQGAEVAAAELHRLDQVLLGPLARRQHRQPEGHAEPQVPDAGDRRLAAAPRARLRRPRLLPPSRPAHADRGNGAGR